MVLYSYEGRYTSDKTGAPELKECPLCGSDMVWYGVAKSHSENGEYDDTCKQAGMVYCEDCGCRVTSNTWRGKGVDVYFITMFREAAEKWNKRVEVK